MYGFCLVGWWLVGWFLALISCGEILVVRIVCFFVFLLKFPNWFAGRRFHIDIQFNVSSHEEG